MATDNEQLVLSISADTRQIQRQLKSLVGQTQANTKAIEDAFKGIDSASTGAFDRVAANSNRAFTTAEQGAKRFQTAMRASTVQTSNLAAQLNDIGVQLAGGQSPFLIALQQGTQITQALGPGAGVRGAVTAVAGAFTSLINPVSLATIAIIALGGTAIQYFSDLLSNSDAAELTLEKQVELISKVASRWGDAMPALKAYADELERAQDAATRQAAAEIPAKAQFEGLAEQLRELTPQFTAAQRALQGIKADPVVIRDLGNAFGDLRDKLDAGTATTADMQRVQDALASTIGQYGIPQVQKLTDAFQGLAGAISEAIGKADTFRREGVPNIPSSSLPALGGLSPLQSVNGRLTGDSIEIQNARAEATRSEYQREQERLAKRSARGGGGRSSSISEAEREREAVKELIEQLEFEQSMIGKTAAERAEANALRRAGAEATDIQKQRISELVEATYAERDAIKANEEAMRELQDISRDVLEGLVSDLKDGKSRSDILANALSRIGDRLLNSALDGLFSTRGSGRSGGLLGGAIIPGILHSGGIAGRDGYGHGRAVAPSAFSGAKRYHGGGIAGLRHDEVPAILQRGERVIPRGASAGGSSISAPVSIMIDATGADAVGLARVERQIEALKADLPGAVVKTVKDAQKRRVL